jgi:hypothetical protein
LAAEPVRGGGLWLALTALPALIGAPLLSHPTFERYGFLARTALSAGVGTVVLSLVMTAAALAPVPWGVAWLTGASLVVVLFLRPLLGREAEGARPAGGGSRAVVLGAGAVSAGAVAAALFATYAGATASTDLFHFWGPKAEAFAASRSIDAEFLRAPWHDHLHPDYPPLATNLFAFASLGIGRLPWGTVPYTYPLVLAAFALALSALLASDRPRAEGHAVAALVVADTALLGNAFLVGGTGDIYLVFFAISSAAILCGPDAGRDSRLLLSGLLLAGAASAKVEGLVLAGAAVALFLLVTPRSRSLRAAVLLLAPTAACLGAWLAYGWTRQLFRFYVGYGSFGKLYPENLPLVLQTIGSEFLLAAWGLPFLVPLVVLLAARKSPRMLLPLGLAVLLTAFYLFTYLHATVLVRDWVTWSAGRIFTPVALLLALAPLARDAPNGS